MQLQVMQTERFEHCNLGGAFTLLVAKNEKHVGYTESQGHPRLITDSQEVRELEARYAIMRTQALRPSESMVLIEKMLGDR